MGFCETLTRLTKTSTTSPRPVHNTTIRRRRKMVRSSSTHRTGSLRPKFHTESSRRFNDLRSQLLLQRKRLKGAKRRRAPEDHKNTGNLESIARTSTVRVTCCGKNSKLRYADSLVRRQRLRLGETTTKASVNKGRRALRKTYRGRHYAGTRWGLRTVMTR